MFHCASKSHVQLHFHLFCVSFAPPRKPPPNAAAFNFPPSFPYASVRGCVERRCVYVVLLTRRCSISPFVAATPHGDNGGLAFVWQPRAELVSVADVPSSACGVARKAQAPLTKPHTTPHPCLPTRTCAGPHFMKSLTQPHMTPHPCLLARTCAGPHFIKSRAVLFCFTRDSFATAVSFVSLRLQM